MNITTKIAAIALTTASLAAGGIALADRSDGERGGRHSERMLERVSDRLELDDNQRTALDALFTEVTEMRDLMKGDSENIRTEMTSLLSAETLDQGAALEMINSRAAALQDNAPELVAAAAVFFDGLDAEQKADIEQLVEKGRRHHRH